MVDNLCDVCRQKPMVGVASTSMPMSAAYCLDCASRGADPEIVFICLYDDFGTRFEEMACPDNLTTFKNGQYLTYQEWALQRKEKPPEKDIPEG